MIYVSRNLQRCNHREFQIVSGHLSGFGLKVGRFLLPEAVLPRALRKTKEGEHGGQRARRSAREAMKAVREDERNKEAEPEEEDTEREGNIWTERQTEPFNVVLFSSVAQELNSAKVKAIVTYSKRCRQGLQLMLQYPLSGVFCAGHDANHGLFLENWLCLSVTSDTGDRSQYNLVA